MSLSNNLKNSLINKILIIKVEYIDVSDNTLKSKFFSNDFCKIYDGITSGNLLTPENLIDTIPSFIREIDLIENETIIKSDYNIVLNNYNEEFTSFFLDNIFVNQKVSFYITTENDYAGVSSTYGDYLLLATGNINEIQLDSNIQIKIKEINTFEKKIPNENKVFDYNDLINNLKNDESLNDTMMPIALGNFKNLKGYNVKKLASDSLYMQKVGITVGFIYDMIAGYTKLTVSTATAEILRRYLKPGDKVFVQDNACGTDGSSIAISYVQQGFMTSTSTDCVFYFEKSDQLNELGAGKYIYILADDASYFNSDFLLSQTVPFDPTYYNNINNFSMINTIAAFSNDWSSTGKWIQVTNDMSFVQNGDVVRLYCKRASSSAYYNYEMLIIDYFDASTNKLYLQDWVSQSVIPLTGTINSSTNRALYELHYSAIQSIKIDNKTYYNKHKSFEIAVGPGSELKHQVETKATMFISTTDLNTVTFTSTKVAYLGNMDRVSFVNNDTLTTPYTPSVSYVSNGLGGNDITITYKDGFTTHSQITSLSLPSMTCSSLATGSTVFTLDPLKQNVFYQLSGGKYSTSFFCFNTHYLASTGPTSLQFEPYTFVFWFKENSLPFTAYSTDLSYFQTTLSSSFFKQITYNSTDSQDTIGQTIADALNSVQRSVYTQYSFFVAYYNSTTKRVVVKHTYRHNIDIRGSFFANFSGSNFGIYNIENNNSHWIELFKDGLNTGSSLPAVAGVRRFLVSLDKVGLSITKGKEKSHTLFGDQVKITGLSGTYPFNRRTLTLGTSAKDYFKSNEKSIIINKHNFINVIDSDSRNVYKTANDIRMLHYREERDGYTDRVYVNKEFTYDVNNNANNSSFVDFSIYELIDTTGDVFFNINSPLQNVKDLLLQTSLIYELSSNDFDITSFNLLKTNHSKFSGNVLIDSNQSFYKSINYLLKSFNLNCYSNNSGKITANFLNVYDTSSYTAINYYDCKDIKVYSNEYQNISLKYNILQNQEDNTYTVKTFTSSYLNTLNSLLKLTGIKEIDTNIEYDFFALSFGGYTYEDLFKAKVFSKMKYIEIYLPLDFIELDLNSVISIDNYSVFNSSKRFKVYKIENDFNTLKITAMLLP